LTDRNKKIKTKVIYGQLKESTLQRIELKSKRIRQTKRSLGFPCFVEEGKILCQKALMGLKSVMVRIFQNHILT
jgi:hypothetical protein